MWRTITKRFIGFEGTQTLESLDGSQDEQTTLNAGDSPRMIRQKTHPASPAR